MIEDVQIKVIKMYNKNMEFLKKFHKTKYEKLKLFELGLEFGQIKERYILEYKDNYFDIYDNNEQKWVYNTNSIKYSEEIVNNINFNSKENSFKTFYDTAYEDEIAEKSKKLSMLSNSVFGNAPIIDYVNRNLPPKEEMKEIFIYLIFGVCLGLHLPLIHKKISSKLYLIIEPSLEIFRLSLFVTDYDELSKKTTVLLSIAENEDEFRKRFQSLYSKSLAYNHYIKFLIFSNNFDRYIMTIQHSLVAQGHYLYPYNRELLSLGRTYKYLRDNFNYINISKLHNSIFFQNKKVLVLAAGPSLYKELEFIKNNQNKYIIVAIFSLIPFLEKYEIKADLITQYDEDTKDIVFTLNQIKNINFFKNTIFLFSSHVCNELMNFFPKKNIYVFQALHKVKESFGYLTSPSIGEISYALLHILGSNNISLIGIDMALDPDTGKSHHLEYDFDISKNIDGSASLENFNLRKNKIIVKGNFLEEIETLSVFKASIEHMNMFTKEYKKYSDTKIYNLSNGAYFEDTIPLKSESIDTSFFVEINKNLVAEEITKYFNNISSNIFTEEDLEYNKLKFEDSIKLKNKLNSFFIGKKYSNNNSFRSALHSIQKELLDTNYVCKDLQKIILNFCNHNLSYIFYFTNLKNINNPKKHIKQLFKIFNFQINRIIKEYISIIKIK